MNSHADFTRREWLGTTAAACAAGLLPATVANAVAPTEVIPAAWATARRVVQSGELGPVYFAHAVYHPDGHNRTDGHARTDMQTSLSALLYITGWRDIYHVRKMGSESQLLAAAKTHDGGEILISPTLQNDKPVITIRGDIANLTISGNSVFVTPELPGKFFVYAKIRGYASRRVPVETAPTKTTAAETHDIARARTLLISVV